MAQLGAALRGLRRTVAPYRILQRGLCEAPDNADLQEALQQSLGNGAHRCSSRCRSLWKRPDEELKPELLFSRQFLGIGTASGDSESVYSYAQLGATKRTESLGPLGPTTSWSRWPQLCDIPQLISQPSGGSPASVLNHHNRERVELWALSCGSHDDWITDHIRNSVDHWVDLRFGTTAQCARILADQRLDVLVELGGFTGQSRLELLCHRPAPVQLSYLGYPGPTYLRCIDGWLGDAVLFEQLNTVDRQAHSLIELKGGYMVFDSGGELPSPRRTAGQRFRFESQSRTQTNRFNN